MDLRAYLAERAELVDRFLDRALPPAEEEPAALHAAMRHLVFPGGKRLRPALAFAGAEAARGPREAALPLAGAVELVHAFSLVHDDLPCMDDADERRGRPSVHAAYGEAVALLAGDALLAAAFECLAEGAASSPAERVVAALRDLAAVSGARHLVGGQVDDLAFDRAERSAERVEHVHRRKSAALIAAAVTNGARLAGADEPTLARLRGFGEDVGVAFQIADDLEDRDDDEACSLARVLGVEAARARAAELLERGLRRIEPLGEPAEPLRQLARYAVWREM